MKPLLIALLAALAAGAAQAADFSLSGQVVHHNDKVIIDFSVASDSEVRVWSDSWQSGLNFDPQFSLFTKDQLMAVDDDNGSTVDASGGYYDAGLLLRPTSAGSFRLVLSASPNNPLGQTLSEGFSFDAQSPIALADWNQPSYDPNLNDQKGGFWRIQLRGVEQASVVPEPGSLLMMLTGLLGLAGLRRSQR